MIDPARSGELTELLAAWKVGEREAFDRLIPLVYGELRRMARRYLYKEREGHTLQPTALVHELFSRLVQQERADMRDRRHFFAIAATTMRRILVDHARVRSARKRGGSLTIVSLDSLDDLAGPQRAGELLMLDECLTRLDAMDPLKSAIVHLRYFAGLSIEETAETLNTSTATVSRHWRMAKAWLLRELETAT